MNIKITPLNRDLESFCDPDGFVYDESCKALIVPVPLGTELIRLVIDNTEINYYRHKADEMVKENRYLRSVISTTYDLVDKIKGREWIDQDILRLK